MLVTLSLSKDLPNLEAEKLRLEQEKLNLEQLLERDKLQLEQQKASVETRWKAITEVGAILSGLLTLVLPTLVTIPQKIF